MRFLDVSFEYPAQNLAFDEVLLDHAETGKSPECLRIWESPHRFVVLGVAQQVRQEIFEEHCREDQIPILRRCSAGGCVLQGPGCLNYVLVLSQAERPEIRNLHDSYRYILGRLCRSLHRCAVQATHSGISDLSLNERKVSGSAQKRRARFILHHGTLLYDADPALMTRYLREPMDRPAYRGERTHDAFVYTIPLSRDALRTAVCAAFDITGEPEPPASFEIEAAHKLAREKYASDAWIWRR